MKRFHFLLRLAWRRSRGEALADGLSVYLASQTEVRAMARLARAMTVAIGLSAAALDRANRAAAKITQFENLRQYAGTLLFERSEGMRQRATSIRTYVYVRIISPKKESRRVLPPGSSALTAVHMIFLAYALI